MNIVLENVVKNYADHNVAALRNISLTFEHGSFSAIRGPSGCGKSSLLNIVGLIDKPSSGKILFDGQDVTLLSDDHLTRIRGERVGFVFQFFNLLSTLTVYENVALPLEMNGKMRAGEIDMKVREILERVGIGGRAKFYPSQLSGGEMQRTAIARAVVHTPQILVADEPTGNLDSENGKSILELLKELNRERQQTIVMATHSEEASAYARRVIEIRDGHLVSNQTIGEQP